MMKIHLQPQGAERNGTVKILQERIAELERERDGYKAMVCSQSCKMHYSPPEGEPLPWDDLRAQLAEAQTDTERLDGEWLNDALLHAVLNSATIQNTDIDNYAVAREVIAEVRTAIDDARAALDGEG